MCATVLYCPGTVCVKSLVNTKSFISDFYFRPFALNKSPVKLLRAANFFARHNALAPGLTVRRLQREES
jgi:hypothetical protein